jgi:hypothetical protein
MLRSNTVVVSRFLQHPCPHSYSCLHLSNPAGHDTTASLIGWTLWFLMNHPEAEAKLVDEILRVMGSGTQPSYQQLSEMRYLNAVLKVRRGTIHMHSYCS